MSVSVFWFLPTHGDGHYLGTAEGARPVDHAYLQQVAQAADRLGFGGVLIPTGRSCEDAWLVANWPVMASFLTTVSAMQNRPNLPASGAACWKAKRWITKASTCMYEVRV